MSENRQLIVEEQNDQEVHSAGNVGSDPEEEGDEVEEEGNTAMHPRSLLITAGVGLVGLEGEGRGKGGGGERERRGRGGGKEEGGGGEGSGNHKHTFPYKE